MRFLQLWLALVGIFLGGMWSSTAVAQSPLCRDVCPTLIARCIETECWLAPGEPERCEFWCELVGTCAVCGPCPVDDCNTVCNTAGAKCDTVCNQKVAGSCIPTTCGEADIDPTDCRGTIDTPLGAPYACCSDGVTACTCQDYEVDKISCNRTTSCSINPISSYTDQAGCADCNDDGDICDTESCSAGSCVFDAFASAAQACYSGPPGTGGVGVCRKGVERCSNGTLGPCIGDTVPSVEICDGLDNDCNGSADDGTCTCPPGDTRPCYPGDPAELGEGICVGGLQTCDIAATWGACLGAVTPRAETCNNIDDDCDGIIDGIIGPCYTGPPGTLDVGICVRGWRTCTGGVWSACSGVVTPKATELCGNGLDDDCNGLENEGCPLMPVPETCNGLDDDLNGLVDDGVEADADCAMGEICEWGTCFVDCSVTMCAGASVCYTDDFRCDDATDPCVDIACAGAGEVCYSGSCYQGCSSSAECDPANELCYQSGRCTSNVNPCEDVQCPQGQVCFFGGCFDTCSDVVPCMSPDLCFDGRCAADACEDIDCPVGDVCAGGTCFTSCTQDDQCNPDSRCYAGRCALDACEDITCPTGTTCFGGFCATVCDASSNCSSGLDCYDGPTDFCLNSSNPCDGVTCGTSETCYQGACYTSCPTGSECDPTNQQCFAGRCVSNDDPQCDSVYCPQGEACFNGACVIACDDDAACDPASYCYQGACVEESCTGVMCPSGESCYRGVCYQACDTTKPCQAPDGCFDGRCAPSACEAQAVSYIVDYNDNHPFRKAGKRIRAYQAVTPWLYGRAFSSPGTTAVQFMDSPPPALARPKKARVVLYRDPSRGSEPGEYALYLINGANSMFQDTVEAVYSIQFDGVNPDVLKTEEANKEAYWVTDNDPRHITALVTSGIGQRGGVLIGHLPANRKWRIKLSATFHGGIDGWEFVNAEDGSVYELNQNYPLHIRSEDFAPSDQLSPEIGTSCRRDSPGVCEMGTYLACENYERVCAQTVFPATLELCDGIDNDCDGRLDEVDTDLRVPMVYKKQGAWSGWQSWLTFDTRGTSRQLLDYTPADRRDDRVGSTKITLPGQGEIQTDYYQSHAFGHRDLRNGRITFPFFHGKEGVTGDEEEFEFDGSTSWGYYLDDLYIAWYEDRKPGPTNDETIDEWYTDEVEMDLAWEMVLRGGKTETDGDVVGVDWYGPDVRFNMSFDYGGDWEDNPFTWYAWAPGSPAQRLYKQARLRILISAARLEETACLAPNVTVSGCPLGRYTCGGGELRCTSATDFACNTCIDQDGDGHPGFDAGLCPSGTDCNDDDPTVSPDSPEQCNGMDDNCDGLVDQTAVGCPGGKPLCGPQECNFNNVCVCPDGPEDADFNPATMDPCYCGEGLKP